MERYFKNLMHLVQEGLDKDQGKSIRSPESDWRRFAAAFLVVSLGIIIWSGYFFLAINEERYLALPDGIERGEGFTREKLSNALSYFKDKEERSSYLLTNRPVIVDPSK